MVFSLPANTLTNNGDRLILTASVGLGSFSTTAQCRFIDLTGATGGLLSSTSGKLAHYQIEIRRYSATLGAYCALIVMNDGTVHYETNGIAADFTTDLTWKWQGWIGAGSPNSVVQDMGSAVYYPTP